MFQTRGEEWKELCSLIPEPNLDPRSLLAPGDGKRCMRRQKPPVAVNERA